MPSAGEILNGRYRLDDRIAAGGMGEVWRATDTVLGRDVAVKTLHADRAVDPGFQTRFRNEARAMAALHHPGVADVYDFGETANGSDAYIVMARVDGEPLTQRIAERGRLSPAETMSVVAQAGRALEAAHQAGIVHRDVKPGNLVIKRDGTVVLVDFGVARSAGTATLTGVGEVVGTAMYIAPEQVSKEQIGPATDVYALGVVAYHCLAGQPPFLGDNPIAIAMQHVNEPPPPLPDDVPPAVRQVVTTAMAKSPAERYPSAAAMAEAADRAVGGDTTAILAAPGAYAPAAYAPPAYATEAYPPPGYGAEAPVATTAVARGGRRRVLVLAGAAAVLIAGAATAAALLIPDATDDPGTTVPSSSVGAEVGTGNAPAPAGGTRTSKSSRPGRTTPAPGNGEPRPSTTAPSESASPSPSESTSPTPDDTGTEPPGGGNSEPPAGGEEEPDENEPDENENENPPENGEQPVPPPAQP